MPCQGCSSDEDPFLGQPLCFLGALVEFLLLPGPSLLTFKELQSIDEQDRALSADDEKTSDGSYDVSLVKVWVKAQDKTNINLRLPPSCMILCSTLSRRPSSLDRACLDTVRNAMTEGCNDRGMQDLPEPLRKLLCLGDLERLHELLCPVFRGKGRAEPLWNLY